MADRDNRYPYPDPLIGRMLQYRPPGWFHLTPYEQSLRGRYALVSICAGLDPMLAWFYAMKEDALESIENDIGALTDDQIEGMVTEKVGNAMGFVRQYQPRAES